MHVTVGNERRVLVLVGAARTSMVRRPMRKLSSGSWGKLDRKLADAIPRAAPPERSAGEGG